ncbi:hypothetical protein FF38_06114 [Lucilia cuprina]|uniref:HECT-type E3 ubiquitin transferase n=1 Tax=Lucilia cuprina TaxID=7375 RepID=A0A0L0C6X7_LUCCU|nr:hypothetical protein FF38_06114 [Lucilia cuprina]
MNNLDPEIYNSIRKLRDFPNDQVESLDLDFTIGGSQGQIVDLIPNGSKIQVNSSSKFQYITELCKYKLSACFRPQTLWLLDGLNQIIPVKWLNIFNATELNNLVNGVNQDYDVEELKANTEYNLYQESDQDIQWLWECTFCSSTITISDSECSIQVSKGG